MLDTLPRPPDQHPMLNDDVLRALRENEPIYRKAIAERETLREDLAVIEEQREIIVEQRDATQRQIDERARLVQAANEAISPRSN